MHMETYQRLFLVWHIGVETGKITVDEIVSTED